MKFIVPLTLIAVIVCVGFSGCGADGRIGSSSSAEENIDSNASYAFGLATGNDLKSNNLFPNIDEFIKGINDALGSSEPRYSVEEALGIIRETFLEQRRLAENKFLAENSTKPGIIVTSSGLQYEVLSEGTGPKPTATDTVRVHYEGTFTDGNVFDSSHFRGQPAEFLLERVISGWTEGIQLMSVGSKYRFFVPSDLGYGSEGMDRMPPYSTLIFEVELLDIL